MARKEIAVHDQTNILPLKRLLTVFAALASALLITFIDQNSIGVALPTIGKDLNAASTITWAGTSSLIANTAFQVLYGRMSDIFGRKPVIIFCLFLLALGDLLCGFAKTGPLLYFFRAISGVANGGIMALAMMIVSDVVTLEQRGKYQGILGSCVGLGNSIGPFIAAGFTQRASWRYTFFLIAPLAALDGVILIFVLPRSTIPKEDLKTKLKKIDYAGILLSTAAILLLLIPISGIGSEFRVSSPMVISMLTLGSICALLFVLNEWKLARLPMIPLRLFKTKALAAMLIQNFLVGLVFYTYSYYLPLYYQSARQMSLYKSAELLLPLVVTQATFSTLSGQYVSRMKRYGEVIWTGYALWTLGCGLNLLFDRHFSIVGLSFILILQGIGVGFVFQPTLVAAQAHSRKEDRAVVISARNFLRSMGGGCGLAIASAVYSNSLKSHLPKQLSTTQRAAVLKSSFSSVDFAGFSSTERTGVLNAYMGASRSVFIMWVAIMGFCLATMVFVKDRGLARKEDQKEKDVPLSESDTPPETNTEPDTVKTEPAKT